MTAFIDVHVHPPVAEFFDGPIAPHLESLRRAFEVDLQPLPVEDIVGFYRDHNARAVLLGWDNETTTNRRPLDSTDVARLAAEAPDVFSGFGSVDPAKGARAVADVHSAARLGLKGLAFHPISQAFDASDRTTFPIWETATEHGLVCLFHTGFSHLGSGEPGGGGLRLDLGQPTAVDVVAARFPELRIVISHRGELWLEEALHVAVHKANVFIDLAGQSPKRFGEAMRAALAGPLTDRLLFGSAWPFASPDSWLSEWESLGLPAAINRKVLHDNAATLLGLDDDV